MRHLIEKHHPRRSIEFLTRMFELLDEQHAVPEWMRREAIYDADSRLRERAARKNDTG